MALEVGRWLEGLGLGEYVEVFAENAVDARALPALSEDDLRELGVKLGHRRVLQVALAELANAREADAREPPFDEAERRQLTVMFCDLADSTALSQRMDPEELREISRGYQRACQRAIERYDGYVARYMGDGVLAYFGYPRAHEDDAERAVRAGLEVIGAIGELDATEGVPRGATLRVRVGIASGPVVVGDLVGEGAARENAVVGETPNLAARLQGFAEPGTVVVSPETRRLATDRFAYQSLGERALKGIAEPVEIFRVAGERSVESRFQAQHPGTLTQLVGREDESALILRRWERAARGEGQVVLVSGEPGIGKSRMGETLREQIATARHAHVAFQCSPHNIDTAFHPVVSYLEHAAGFDSATGAGEKFERLEALLQRSGDRTGESLALIAGLLTIASGEAKKQGASYTQHEKELLLGALARHVEGLAATRPVLLVAEDVHWVDPSTLELLDGIARRIEDLPILMLVTYRPEFEPPWTGQAHVTLMALSRLSRRETRIMVRRVADTAAIPEAVVEDVVLQTDGVPLFVEELTRSVFESEGGVPGSSQRPRVPSTLQDSLMARLDHLDTGKRVAQSGAVIGREFTRDILEPACELATGDLDRGLAQLVDAGLVFRSGTGQTAVYQFKHALLRDVAYGSLLNTSRRRLHQRIAQVLTERRPEQSALLAHHWEAAEHHETALEHRLAAAQRALGLYAQWEAVAQYLRALDLLERLPDARETRLRHVDLMIAITQVRGMFWKEGDERARALEHLSRAIETAAESGQLAKLAQLEAFTGERFHDESKLADAIDHANESGDVAVQTEVERLYTGYLGQRGRFAECHVHTDRVIELYGQLGNTRQQGLALASEGRCYRARAGSLDESLAYARRAREVLAATDDRLLRPWIAMESECYMYKGVWEACVEVAEEFLPAAWAIENFNVILFSTAWAAIASVKLGRLDPARRLLDDAIKNVDPRHGSDFPKVYMRIALAGLLIAEGDTGGARQVADRAVALGEGGDFPLDTGAAYRALGEAHAAGGDDREAEAAYRESIERLRAIQSPPELAQSLLAHGRFKLVRGDAHGRRPVEEALGIFERINAVGWVEEARAVLRR